MPLPPRLSLSLLLTLCSLPLFLFHLPFHLPMHHPPSSLEYTPGVYNASYIARVAQMVQWAKEQDIYLILDLHEDLYSVFIQPEPNATGIPGLLTPGGGQDGAPAWAVHTDGWPALNLFGIGDLNLAVMKAFDSFYNNTVIPGLPQGAAPG